MVDEFEIRKVVHVNLGRGAGEGMAQSEVSKGGSLGDLAEGEGF